MNRRGTARGTVSSLDYSVFALTVCEVTHVNLRKLVLRAKLMRCEISECLSICACPHATDLVFAE